MVIPDGGVDFFFFCSISSPYISFFWEHPTWDLLNGNLLLERERKRERRNLLLLLLLLLLCYCYWGLG